MRISLVENLGWHENYKCGYCKSQDTNVSYGIWAHFMTVDDYKFLLDQGWRRSGKYCYKPDLDRICCPHHTIKCDASNFQLQKCHKKVLKRFMKFLTDGDPGPDDITNLKSNLLQPNLVNKTKNIPKPGVGADPDKPKCLNQKLLRRQKYLTKNQEKSLSKEKSTEQNNTQNDLSNEKSQYNHIINDPSEINPIPANINLDIQSQPCATNTNKLDEMLSQILNKNESAHKFQLRILPVDMENEQFQQSLEQSYPIYKKYQMKIHKDPETDIKFSSFKRFLVDTPLQNEPIPMASKSYTNYEEKAFITFSNLTQYGSYHIQYVIDDVHIIGVGVCDILPGCISSKYFFYDPKYHHLSLGTLSALFEIGMARFLPTLTNGLVPFDYYMGYYIHTCPKMRYKAQYKPCYLRCLKHNKWIDFSLCEPQLNACQPGQSFRDFDFCSNKSSDMGCAITNIIHNENEEKKVWDENAIALQLFLNDNALITYEQLILDLKKKWRCKQNESNGNQRTQSQQPLIKQNLQRKIDNLKTETTLFVQQIGGILPTLVIYKGDL